MEIGHWYEIVLVLGICALFWSTSVAGMLILLFLTYAAEILLDNITPRLTWRWMLIHVWIVGFGLSFMNFALAYARVF
jgi:ech hydrogenase subunit B